MSCCITVYDVPVTGNMSALTLKGKPSFMESAYENALWEYNSARAHDHLPPVTRLPPGTTSRKETCNES